jgi:hypothetical protein
MEMTMRVTGEERTEHGATTAAVGVTYWATEFERIYSMTAAGIRGKRALIRRCPAGLSDDHSGSQSERSACSLGSRVGADSGGGGAALSESVNYCEFTDRQPGHFDRDARLLRPAPRRVNHRDVSTLIDERRAEAASLWKSPLSDRAEERALTVAWPGKSSVSRLIGYSSPKKHDMTGEQTPPVGAMEGEGAYNKNAKLPATGGACDWKAESGFGFLQYAVPLARGDRKALVDVEVSFTYRTEVLPDEYPDVRKVVSDALAALQSKSRKGVYWEIYARDVAAKLFQDYRVFSSLTVRLVIHPDDLRSYLRTATATVLSN